MHLVSQQQPLLKGPSAHRDSFIKLLRSRYHGAFCRAFCQMEVTLLSNLIREALIVKQQSHESKSKCAIDYNVGI